MKNHICDSDCPSCEKDCSSCESISNCKFTKQESFDFILDSNTDYIDWTNIPELDVSPEASQQKSSKDSLDDNTINQLTEIDIAEKKEKLEKQKNERVLNTFLKKYAAKFLIWSIVVIIILYIADVFLINMDKKNSSFAEPLFTLLQTVITGAFGYLLGSNHNN